MTANQIAYVQAMESARHNKTVEAETARSNRANEGIAQQNANTNERSQWFSNLLSSIF